MSDTASPSSPLRWLLALESSTANGGASLFRNGECHGVRHLPEGLRHGRELVSAAAALLAEAGVEPASLWAVAASIGPGSYTGIRVGTMAAKALCYATGAKLTGVSSLAAYAAGLRHAGGAKPGDITVVVQDARRDEVYLGVYQNEADDLRALAPDAAVTPEEAAAKVRELVDGDSRPHFLGSAFTTYREMFHRPGDPEAAAASIDPAGTGWLAWRQILREETADPLALSPVYLRRDAAADWRRDALIN